MRVKLLSAFPLKAVIFDCDGVLVDTEPLHYRAFQRVLAPLGLGHTYEHYLERYIGFDDRDAFLEAFREASRPIDGAILTQLMRAKEQVLQAMIGNGISSFPGVIPLVRELAARGIPLAVASGALRQEVDAFIGGLGLTGVFSVIVAADDVKQSKPNPETYLRALEQLHRNGVLGVLEAGSCIAIEDTPAGIQAAKEAGVHVIGVTNSFPADQLEAADQVVESLGELSVEGLVRLIGRDTR
jgi:HAD superfamily hydrolase (TIGR01509 family)